MLYGFPTHSHAHVELWVGGIVHEFTSLPESDVDTPFSGGTFLTLTLTLARIGCGHSFLWRYLVGVTVIHEGAEPPLFHIRHFNYWIVLQGLARQPLLVQTSSSPFVITTPLSTFHGRCKRRAAHWK